MFLRIDDVDIHSYEKVVKILKGLEKSNFLILLCVIYGSISSKEIQTLLQLRDNVYIVFHGLHHSFDEFIQVEKLQKASFEAGEEMWKSFGGSEKIFCPPYNTMDIKTLDLLSEFGYTAMSIDYKGVERYKLIKSCFHIYTTNIFLNKKNETSQWFTEDKKNIIQDIEHLRSMNIDIGCELHPQHLSGEDLSMLVGLLIFVEKKYG